MKFGLTLGAILLASNVAFAQVAIDMATLERRVDDAQAAYDRNPSSADRQEMSEIRDEIGYLRVKTRLAQTVTRTERQRLSDHLDRYMTQIGNGRTSSNDTYDRSGSRNDRSGNAKRSGRDHAGPPRNPERQRSRCASGYGADVGYRAG